MSNSLPDRVDVARQVQARRIYEGVLPLAGMTRLCAALASTAGEVRYRAAFGLDGLGISYLDLDVEVGMVLVCQRTLEEFIFPVHLDQRLGVIAEEAEEAALPEGYEPLMAADGHLALADVIEDELILALPVVPLKPGAPLVWNDPLDDGEDEVPVNPFAALSALKKN